MQDENIISQVAFSEGVKFEEQKEKIYYASKNQLLKMFALFSAYGLDDEDEIRDWLKKTSSLVDMLAGLSNHINLEIKKLARFGKDDFAKMLIGNYHNELVALNMLVKLKHDLLSIEKEHRFTKLHLVLITEKVKQIRNGIEALEENSKINAALMRRGHA